MRGCENETLPGVLHNSVRDSLEHRAQDGRWGDVPGQDVRIIVTVLISLGEEKKKSFKQVTKGQSVLSDVYDKLAVLAWVREEEVGIALCGSAVPVR